MPILTLAQLASHATRLATTPGAPLSLASEYVNLAYHMVSQDAGQQHQAKEATAYASTSTSDNRLSYPSDYDYALGLRVGVPNSWSTATSRTTSWEPLTKQPATWFEVYQSTDSATPQNYGEFATWLELVPSPNSAYSVELRYVRKLSDMTASTATPVLDEQWHWPIAIKAAELLAAVESNTTAEALNARRYTLMTRSLRADQTRKRMDPRGMYVTFGRRHR